MSRGGKFAFSLQDGFTPEGTSGVIGLHTMIKPSCTCFVVLVLAVLFFGSILFISIVLPLNNVFSGAYQRKCSVEETNV